MIGTMYGAVCGDYPGSETWQGEFDGNWVAPTFYLLKFNVIELRKDASFRPEGICFVSVVFSCSVDVPTLDLSSEDLLWWGGDAALDADLRDMLPFSTGPYHGVRRLDSEQLVGHGSFFRTVSDLRSHAKRETGPDAVDMI